MSKPSVRGMNHHTTTRIPVDDDYAALVGKAVYVFAYYEWTIIWIIEHLTSGFVHEYSRGKPITSGGVKSRFKTAISNLQTNQRNVSATELNSCLNTFSKLVEKRNALIHAHPCTDKDGAQILTYQTQTSKLLTDMKWPSHEVENIISEIDEAACEAGAVFDRLRK